MASPGRPSDSASCALSMADVTSASRITSCADHGAAAREFSSIRRASKAWSSDPQLTPMRTGLSKRQATSIMRRKLSSRRALVPTLPGLIRYLESACAHSGKSVRSLWPL